MCPHQPGPRLCQGPQPRNVTVGKLPAPFQKRLSNTDAKNPGAHHAGSDLRLNVRSRDRLQTAFLRDGVHEDPNLKSRHLGGNVKQRNLPIIQPTKENVTPRIGSHWATYAG